MYALCRWFGGARNGLNAADMSTLYDNIGRTYSGRRQSDPRIASAIEGAVAGCDSILNVGAGTGSYEPRSQMVVAVEPSRTMISQRPVGAAPVVQGCAEALPFRDRSFDAVLGVLTVHHWRGLAHGLTRRFRGGDVHVVVRTEEFGICSILRLFCYF